MSYDVVRSVNTALGYGLGHARTIFETPATPNRILDTRSTLTRIESVCNRYHAVSVFHYAEPSLVFVALFLQFCVWQLQLAVFHDSSLAWISLNHENEQHVHFSHMDMS